MKNLATSPLAESLACFAVGLRTAVSAKLILFSASLWLGAALLWTLILVFAWSLVKTVAAFVAAWALLGVFVAFPNWLPDSAQAKLAGVPLPDGAEALLGSFFHVVTWMVVTAMAVAGVILTARIGLEFFLMPLVRRDVERQYPPFPTRPSGSLLVPLANMAKSGALVVAAGLPCLFVPVVNAVLLLMLFGYLNVRTLVNEALDGLATPEEQRSVIRTARWQLVLVGSLLAATATVPFVGLLIPAWTGASTCHLCLRTLSRLREESVPPGFPPA